MPSTEIQNIPWFCRYFIRFGSMFGASSPHCACPQRSCGCVHELSQIAIHKSSLFSEAVMKTLEDFPCDNKRLGATARLHNSAMAQR
jgi:hypothetical protein